MKKSILVASLLAVLLSACQPSANQLALAKSGNEAIFTKEGTFRNCEVGRLNWMTAGNGGTYESNVNVVVCPDKPVTSVKYRSGKTEINESTVGTPMSDEEFKAIQLERQRKEALSKLSDSDRKALGLHEDK